MTSTDLRRGDFACARCEGDTWTAHDVAGADGSLHKTLAMKACAGCGLLHPSHADVVKTDGQAVDVCKDIDTSETAVQRDEPKHKLVDLVQPRSGCPRDATRCGAAVDGLCSLCHARVGGPDPVAKTLATLRALAEQ